MRVPKYLTMVSTRVNLVLLGSCEGALRDRDSGAPRPPQWRHGKTMGIARPAATEERVAGVVRG